MGAETCGICGATGFSIDEHDNLFCSSCKATGTRGLDGEDYWEPGESWTDDELDGHHGFGEAEEGEGEGEQHHIGEDDEYVEHDDDVQAPGAEGDGDDEEEGEGNPDEGDGGDEEFDIEIEARDYYQGSDNEDGFPDPVSIVVDGCGKLLPAVRWLRDLTSMRDGKPIGLEEAKGAMTAVVKENKRIEVKDVPSEAASLVLTAASFANVLAREYTPKQEENGNGDGGK